MTQFYAGVKIIEAWDQEKDDQPGYAVKYPDGYISWSPKEAFEKAYYPMGTNPSKVSEMMVQNFIEKCEFIKLDPKRLLMKAELLTGFTQYETSACVDPENYNENIGREICTRRLEDTLWLCLGFVVQWGRFGLKE